MGHVIVYAILFGAPAVMLLAVLWAMRVAARHH